MSVRSRWLWREPQAGALTGRQAEGDLRLGQGDTLDDLGNGGVLRPLAFEELEPGRRGREQLAHLHAGAASEGRGAHRALGAAVDHNLVRRALLAQP